MPVDDERLGIFEKLLVQRALVGHQPVLEKLAHDIQIGAALQQPRGAANIARGGRAIRQRPRVFVDAQHQQGGFQRLDRDALGVDLLDQQRRRRAHRVAGEMLLLAQLAGQRVVIDEMDRRGRAHPAHGREALRIDDRHVLDQPAALEVVRVEKRQRVAVEVEKVLYIPVDAAREDRRGGGVEFGRAQQQRQRRQNRRYR
ncbi:MAG: hypothetical protein M5U29_18575, partial [Anaerolineae bacterium]|nr:hypothetical protein [Anaerolineae bacterium]